MLNSAVAGSPGHQQVALTDDDLLVAMEGFTPAALRNVPLHGGGEVSWKDIGGLRSIKSTLVETLQLPAKVLIPCLT